MGYETQFLLELEKLVRSLDRRISHGKDRLRRSAEAKQKVCFDYETSLIVILILWVCLYSKWLVSMKMEEVKN